MYKTAALLLSLLAACSSLAPPDDVSAALGKKKGQGGQPAPQPPPPPPPSWGVLASSSFASTSTLPPAESTFSVQVRDVFLYALYFNGTGAHAVRVDVINPDGALYQQNSYTLDPATAPRDPATGAYWGWSDLPVAGTYISQYALYGNWTVDVLVDGVQVTAETITFAP